MAFLSRTLVLLPLLFVSVFSRIIFQGEDNHPFSSIGIHGPLGLSLDINHPNILGHVGDKINSRKNNIDKNNEKADFETKFLGSWMLHSKDAGVSAMHLQLMPNNKAIWYDTTNLGPSAIKNDPPYCRPLGNNQFDCFAHGVEYDIETANVRTLKMEFNPWCSSGGLAPNGDLVSTGGNDIGLKALRIISQCQDCQFRENPTALSANRWYASNHMLEDGSFVVVGGRGAHNYEIIPYDQLKFPIKQIGLPILADTEDEKENNLYPFVYLVPDGNLYLFTNFKSILLDPQTGETVREFPDLPGGSRNYPASGMSALLPLKLSADNTDEIEAEVLVCGGNTHDAFKYSEFEPRQFFPALKDCGRISITKPGSEWEIEDMPTGRVMGDMLILPTGDLLMINGAQAGTSGWFAADQPNLTPILYSPEKKKGERFKELAPATIPRMYHSASAVLPDGQILVAGSNTNPNYDFKAKFPTELRVEKFSPPYLAPELQQYRPEILENESDKKLKYADQFRVRFQLDDEQVDESNIKLTMYAPPFTTHGFSQNQRLLILGLIEVKNQQITAMAPPTGKIATPGYYLIFVVYRGVPSKGMWVHIQ